MREDEIAGISREFDRVLNQVAAGADREPGQNEERAAERKDTGPDREEGRVDEMEPAGIKEAAASQRRVRKPENGTEDRLRPGRGQREGQKAAVLGARERYPERSRKQEEDRPGLLRARDCYAAAFLIPVIIMIIIFAQRGIFPFGEQSFLRTDMYHQYAPFFSEFKHKLSQGGSLLYSWNIGLGVNLRRFMPIIWRAL